jgi:hypothetical protein
MSAFFLESRNFWRPSGDLPLTFYSQANFLTSLLAYHFCSIILPQFSSVFFRHRSPSACLSDFSFVLITEYPSYSRYAHFTTSFFGVFLPKHMMGFSFTSWIHFLGYVLVSLARKAAPGDKNTACVHEGSVERRFTQRRRVYPALPRLNPRISLRASRNSSG